MWSLNGSNYQLAIKPLNQILLNQFPISDMNIAIPWLSQCTLLYLCGTLKNKGSKEDLANIKYSLCNFYCIPWCSCDHNNPSISSHYFTCLPAVCLAGDNWNKNKLLYITHILSFIIIRWYLPFPIYHFLKHNSEKGAIAVDVSS